MGKGISQTALSIYRDCPYAHYCYKSKFDAVFYDDSVLSSGKYIHDAIDKYYKNHYLSSGDSQDILLQTYETLKEIWDTKLPVKEYQKAYACLENHANWEAGNINNGIRIKPLTEIEVKSEYFYGIIDYVDLANKQVFDWKTGKNATLSYGHRIQASIYKELYDYQFKESLKQFTFFFLYPNLFETIYFGTKKQDEVDKDVQQLKEQILRSWETNDFPKQPRNSSSCRYCNYRLYCKVLGGKENET